MTGVSPFKIFRSDGVAALGPSSKICNIANLSQVDSSVSVSVHKDGGSIGQVASTNDARLVCSAPSLQVRRLICKLSEFLQKAKHFSRIGPCHLSSLGESSTREN